MNSTQPISPCLWYDGNAEEAARFYTSVFPDSKIDRVARCHSDWPGGKAGDPIVVSFTLKGQPYQALNGGPNETFNSSVSLSVSCANQDEVDRYWEALTAAGGAPMACGWLQDKFGLRWQIVPEVFFEMMADDDPEKSKRVMEAMMQMVKFDVAKLEEAYNS